MRIDLGCLYVRKAPPIDRDKLCVRINGRDKPDCVNWYDYIHLRTESRRITCKLRGDDIPDIKHKCTKQIYINEHLRGILGVAVRERRRFSVEKASHWRTPYYFVRYHPDDVVRVSTWLAFIALTLGLLSIVVAIFS